MKRWNLYAGALIGVLGILIVIFPAFWVKVVVTLLGLGSIAYGIYNLKYTKAIFENTVYERSILIKSILSIVIGVMAVLFPLAFGNTAWNAMIWLLIIYLIIAAVIGFYAAALLKDSGIDRKRYFLENLGLVAIAVVLILISPKALGTAIIRIIGIAAIIAGVALIVYELMFKKDIIVTDVEVKDDDSEETAAAEPEKTEE